MPFDLNVSPFLVFVLKIVFFSRILVAFDAVQRRVGIGESWLHFQFFFKVVQFGVNSGQILCVVICSPI